ncbi:MAG: hypothetical protein VB078_04200 [Clostridiaceae bacterium]|nr:hypothetical protein [Clostridiaceae bacterium]
MKRILLTMMSVMAVVALIAGIFDPERPMFDLFQEPDSKEEKSMAVFDGPGSFSLAAELCLDGKDLLCGILGVKLKAGLYVELNTWDQEEVYPNQVRPWLLGRLSSPFGQASGPFFLCSSDRKNCFSRQQFSSDIPYCVTTLPYPTTPATSNTMIYSA